jgi:hypothetical protein
MIASSPHRRPEAITVQRRVAMFLGYNAPQQRSKHFRHNVRTLKTFVLFDRSFWMASTSRTYELSGTAVFFLLPA